MENQESTPKRLFRSTQQKMIAGVCGGFAEYFAVDVALVRILWMISLFFSGIGLVAYIIAVVLMPHRNGETIKNPASTNKTPAIVWIVIFITILIFVRWLPFPFHHHGPWFHGPDRAEDTLALLLVGLGLWAAIAHSRRNGIASSRQYPFMRQRQDRMIAGVCGGISKWIQLDVVLVRIGFVLFGFWSHLWMAALLYILLVIVIPEEIEQPINQGA